MIEQATIPDEIGVVESGRNASIGKIHWGNSSVDVTDKATLFRAPQEERSESLR